MIANSQQALGKANELMSYYSQFLQTDFFGDSSLEDDNDDDDEEAQEESFEEHMASKSLSAISGFFNKVKNAFDDGNSVQKQRQNTSA